MNRFITWLHTKQFLSDMTVSYATRNQELEAENAKLLKKIEHKNDELIRAIADYDTSLSFQKAVIDQMQGRIDDLTALNKSYFDAQAKRMDDSFQHFLDNGGEISPETEQDYIDQVLQEQADRAEASYEPQEGTQQPPGEHMRLLHPVRHNRSYKLVLVA